MRSAVASERLRGGHRRSSVGSGRQTHDLDRGPSDDRRDDEPACAVGEDPRRRPASGDDRLCRPAADGAGGGRANRRRLQGAEPGPARSAQWLSRPDLGDTRRHAGTAHPEAQEGLLLPGLPRATADGGEGAHRGCARGLHPGCVDPLRRQPGQSPRHDRHLQEPGLPAVRGDRRQGEGLPRPLEGDWPYLWIDATYVKARQHGRIVSVAVIVAVGVNADGRREVLGMDIGPSEAETFWTAFLRKLARRGLRGVKLVISDAHEGLKAAIARVLHATWQRCRVHFMRNALAHAGKNGRRVVSAFIATTFAQDDADAAKAQWRKVADQLRPTHRRLATFLDEAETDVLAYMTFPKDHRTKIHSTNPLERLNSEVKPYRGRRHLP